MLDSAVRECDESRVSPVQRASFQPRKMLHETGTVMRPDSATGTGLMSGGVCLRELPVCEPVRSVAAP